MPTKTCKQCGETFEGRTAYCAPACFRQMEREYSKRVRKTWSALKKNAHSLVYTAVVRGRLIRQSCEVCGKGDAVAHHDDYAKPLDVRWLCRNHHQQWHRKHGAALNSFAANQSPNTDDRTDGRK